MVMLHAAIAFGVLSSVVLLEFGAASFALHNHILRFVFICRFLNAVETISDQFLANDGMQISP